MKFLEAKKILAGFEGGPPLELLLAMSGQPEPLDPYLSAAAAERGYEARIRTLPFNTLAQTLHSEPVEGEREVFLLFPWDLLPELDWRSGYPPVPRPVEELVAEATRTLSLVTARENHALVYVEAPAPPILYDEHASAGLPLRLATMVREAAGTILPAEAVSLDSLFRSGFPVASSALGDVARTVVDAALAEAGPSCKVLVTDFDNTLWRGVVGEDGVDGLDFEPTGAGFPYFVYQTFLKRLEASGVVLAGVTKNDPDLARAPLERAESVVKPSDFVSILASYNAKSTQIRELADQLNLGLDSFVFVDDNLVELAEVGGALPEVHTVRFPESASELPELFAELARLFHRDAITEEDRGRTEMYRTRLAGLAPKDVAGSDLAGFLSGLEMKLVINDRSEGERTRAVQLINKTNQFNMNGIRRDDDEVARVLAEGGRLYTASLSDRHGTHGEILSCLLDGEGVMRSFVMSCRVVQRRVEHGFLTWLSDRNPGRVALEVLETERNDPFRRFLRDPAFEEGEGGWEVDLTAFSEQHRDDLSLFELETP